MKFNKNIVAFTICLAMYSPIKGEESTEEANRLSDKQEMIISEVASTAVGAVITAVANAIQSAQHQYPVSLDRAHEILQKLMDNLVEGSTFEINDVKYIVTQAQKSLTFENESQANDYQTISQEDAVALLEGYANNFSNEVSFSLKFPLDETLYTLEHTIKNNDTTDSNN